MIYTLTAVHETDSTRSRCWGYTLTEEEARGAALTANDIFFERGYYTHLVVESVEPGVWAFPKVVGWYKAEFNPDTQEYKISECPCPPSRENVVSFSMG